MERNLVCLEQTRQINKESKNEMRKYWGKIVKKFVLKL